MQRRNTPDMAALRPLGFCGYADLLLARESGGTEDMAALADLLGYRYTGPRRPDSESSAPAPAPREPVAEPAPVEFTDSPPADIPFWRLEQRDFLIPAEPVPTVAAGMARAELPLRPTRIAPLARWSALVPPLRAGCTEFVDGGEPDIPATLRLLERGRLLHRLPRHRRRRWGARVQIIIDRSERLTPFFDDQDADQHSLEARLRRLFPRHAVERVSYLGGADVLCATDRRGRTTEYRLPDPGTLVIVLGDLGCLARDPSPVVARWSALGRRLARAGCRAAALTPCSPAYWLPELSRTWTLVAWDRTGPTERLTREQRDARAEGLLRWGSPAIRLEPGLLRDIRLLRGGDADAATEADAWQHEALSSRWSEAATFDAKAAERMRAEFAEPVVNAIADGKDEAEQRRIAEPLLKAVQLVLRWHGAGMDPHVWFSELQSLHPAIRNLLPEEIRVDHLAAAEQALKELATKLASYPDGRRWYRGVYERAPPHYHQTRDPALKAAQDLLYVQAYKGIQDRPNAPPDFRPDRLPPPPGARERPVDLCLMGTRIAASETGAGGPGGSLLATLRAVREEIPVIAASIADDRAAFWASGIPPAWAHDWETDEYGPWTTFRVPAANGSWVEQRLRWIPPGRFWMGSPEGEEGRYSDEGPRHEVTITDGFWLFETACTEALWEAVTGKAPEPRRGAAMPVINVSWDDAQAFIRRINAANPGLDLALPSEAWWEYACRAGTGTPYHFGREITRDQACYEAVAPVPVDSLPPNGWGLREMHGNVWEWCADHWHGDYKSAPTDGSAWIDAGGGLAFRVIRGGSWRLVARGVRSAYRDRFDPSFRNVDVGFRCARVQAASGAEQVAAPADPASRGSAERGRPRGPTSDATLLRVGESVACPVPRVGTMLIRSDSEELHFGRLTKPGWASAIGRDAFGLFTEFTVPDTDITQRLRWIPPGRFRMGSPDDEPGRDRWEGPRHLVTLVEGFWLFDTPCTQALWQAVMGENPSRFQTPTRPVEQVSFDDVAAFLAELNVRLPRLDLVLPSEAQWEYACRAGTDTATHAGPIKILGENNAPVLDAIAWYGGNSGKDFDLDNGWDSTGWPEKQYDHARAGTRPVGLKAANPWGLHDMLGNVWEWCSDTWHDSYEGAPGDGRAWVDPGQGAAGRVMRGASWDDVAPNVRSAHRFVRAPAYRLGSIGFRCARVQSDGGAPAIAKGGEEQARRAERGAATTGPKRKRGATQPKRQPKRK